jgi:streptogramin lyase
VWGRKNFRAKKINSKEIKMFTNRLFYLFIGIALLVVTACAPQSVPTSAISATAKPTIAQPTATALPTLTITEQPIVSPVEQVWSMTGDPNAFNTPDGIAVDAQGNLYVMDSGNNRIQKFDSDGNFLTLWGSKGTDDGQFNCSSFCMVAVDLQGNVFVTDNNNTRIQKFDSNGKFLAKWGSWGSEDGQFINPFGIAVDGQGNVYVGDVGNTRIQKFDGNGKFLMKWGSRGFKDGQFSNDLADIAVDSQGNIYVTDRNNGIYQFDRKGQFLARWDTCGDNKLISSATGVAVDSQDNIYVFDLSNSRMCKYDSHGKFLNNWNGSGSAEGLFASVGGVAVDQQANVYIAELFAGRVRKFRQLGTTP